MKFLQKTFLLILACMMLVVFLAACSQGKVNNPPPHNGSSASPGNQGTITSPDDAVDDLKISLRFNDQGKFKIVIFSDLRLSKNVDRNVLDNMEKILDREKPSLVLLGGDIHDGSISNETELRTVLDAVNQPMEARKIPWCHAFGVDAEGTQDNKTGYSKEEQMQVYMSYPYCVSLADSDKVYGTSNYVLPILRNDSDKIGFNVWCMDANGYLNDYKDGLEDKVLLGTQISGNTNLDCIHFSQRLWYWDSSIAFQEQNNDKPVPGILYFQVPPYQFRYIFRNKDLTEMTGTAKGKMAASERDSGIVFSCYERGDIQGIFCGYNDRHDFAGTYADILLACCSTIGTTNTTASAGARIVDLHNNGEKMNSYMVYLSDLT